jgi:probable rRNA maturation factor
LSVDVGWAVDARPMSDAEVAAAVEAALAFGGRAGIHLSVVLVDDARLCELHERFLGDPSPTDVIAFDLGEDPYGPAAEIYVSVDCALRVARERDESVARELALYLVHGTLHLCGFDDHDDEDRRAMRAAEARVLASLGY